MPTPNPSYRAPGIDSPDPFPFAPFLASLAAGGIRPTLRDYQRISLALRARGPWTVAGLRGVLGALLVRDPDQDEVFQRCFERFFTPQPELRTPASEIDLERVLNDLAVLAREPLARRPEETRRSPATQVDAPLRRRRFSFGRARSLAAIFIVTALALLVWMIWPQQQASLETGAPGGEHEYMVLGPLGQHVPQPADELAVVEEAVPLPDPSADDWQLPATLSAILLLGLLGHVFWLRRARRPPVDEAPIPDPQAPRLFRTNTIGGPPEARLDRETLDQLADALGYFCSDQLSDTLDVPSSIEATGRRGDIPALVFTPARQVRRVLILEDALAEPLAWNPTAAELARGLARRGIPVLYGFFHGVPDSFHTTDGVGYQLEDLEDERRGYLLLIFSDGKGLVRHRDSFVLEALARWPQVAWMELRERRAWDEQSALPARFGLPVYPAGREGLLQALGRFATESGAVEDSTRDADTWRGLPPQPVNVRLADHLELVLGESLLWAQACAMMPPPLSLGLADELRRRFHPDLPPERIERLLALPGTTHTETGLHFSRSVLAVLRAGFAVRRSEEAQVEVLSFLLDKIREAKPRNSTSIEYYSWQWRLERLRLELEPDRALERLAALAQGPLRDMIRGELASAVVGPQPPAAERACIPLRRKPESRRGRQRLLSLAASCGIPRHEAYPTGTGHRIAQGIAGLALVGTVGWTVMTLDPAPGALWQDPQIGMRFRYIPAGTFMMGSPENEPDRAGDETQHEVTLTRAFWMAETEVTQRQWREVMETEPSHFSSCGDECPVERVSWCDAVEFANRLSDLSDYETCYEGSGYEGTPGSGCPEDESFCMGDYRCDQVNFKGLDCGGFRLPTEAEWEYAVRARTTTSFWRGDNLTTEQANYNGNYPYAGNSSGEYRKKTVPVRSFAANSWDLYEVHGNVWEWVWDWYEEYDVELKMDPLGPEQGSTRVIRGGSWFFYARSCRAADRDRSAPGHRGDSLGFRLVRTYP